MFEEGAKAQGWMFALFFSHVRALAKHRQSKTTTKHLEHRFVLVETYPGHGVFVNVFANVFFFQQIDHRYSFLYWLVDW